MGKPKWPGGVPGYVHAPVLLILIGPAAYGFGGWIGVVFAVIGWFIFCAWLNGDLDEEKTPEQIAKEKEEKRRKEEGFYPKQKQ